MCGRPLGSAVFAVRMGYWAPVLLVFALVLVSDLPVRAERWVWGGILAVALSLFQLPCALLCVCLFASWGMWELRFLGGADVKLLWAISLIFGTPLVLIPIALFGGIQGGAARARKKKEIPFVLSIFIGTLWFVIAPFF